jgi:hypothetical protein
MEERKQIERDEGEGTALHVRGKLTFDDFVQIVCTFCMYAKDDILLYSFNAFDADNSGVIDETEFMQLCIIVNNDQPTYPDNFKLALLAFDKNEDGMMDFDEFRELNDKFPMLLFPAFRFQDKVQSRILGERNERERKKAKETKRWGRKTAAWRLLYLLLISHPSCPLSPSPLFPLQAAASGSTSPAACSRSASARTTSGRTGARRRRCPSGSATLAAFPGSGAARSALASRRRPRTRP